MNDKNMILWMGIAALGVGILLLVYGLPDVVDNPGFFANFYLAISIFGIIITGIGVVLVGILITNRKKT